MELKGRKIKHYQGYGSVHAKKITGNNDFLHIKVWGNHEWGIELNDDYSVWNWLVKRFAKNMGEYSWGKIKNFTTEMSWIKDDYGCDVDVCDYKIYFR